MSGMPGVGCFFCVVRLIVFLKKIKSTHTTSRVADRLAPAQRASTSFERSHASIFFFSYPCHCFDFPRREGGREGGGECGRLIFDALFTYTPPFAVGPTTANRANKVDGERRWGWGAGVWQRGWKNVQQIDRSRQHDGCFSKFFVFRCVRVGVGGVQGNTKKAV